MLAVRNKVALAFGPHHHMKGSPLSPTLAAEVDVGVGLIWKST